MNPDSSNVQLNFGDRQRAISNQRLGTILAIGFGGSVVLHLGLIVGINYWWQPAPAIDDEIEITLVEPIAVEPVSPSSQSIKLAPSPSVKPIVLKPRSKPLLTPKPMAIVVKSSPQLIVPQPVSKPMPIAAKSKSKPAGKVKPIPQPVPTPVNPPFPAERSLPIEKPQSKPAIGRVKPISTPIPNPAVNLPFPAERSLPIEKPRDPPTVKESMLQHSDVANDSKLPTQTVAPPVPTKKSIQPPPATPATSLPTNRSNLTRSIGDNNPANYPPKAVKKPLEDRNASDRMGKDQNSDRGFVQSNDSRSDLPDRDGRNRSHPATQTALNPSSGTGNGDGDRSSKSTSDSTTSQTGSGNGDLQCIQNCQIPKLQNLQDSDGGKDRLRIRIVVDANGLVLEATIAKSSDNPQIDSIILAGIKQMQFKPSGKIIKGIVKANILL
jgi:TonB family protein